MKIRLTKAFKYMFSTTYADVVLKSSTYSSRMRISFSFWRIFFSTVRKPIFNKYLTLNC